MSLTSIHICGCLRIHYKIRLRIHVCASMPQRPYLWILYARSMSLESTSATPLEDPCVRAHVSASISVESRPEEPKSGRRCTETDSANRKSALRHNESQQNGVPTTPGRQPPNTKSPKKIFQPHLDVSLPIRSAKRQFCLQTLFGTTWTLNEKPVTIRGSTHSGTTRNATLHPVWMNMGTKRLGTTRGRNGPISPSTLRDNFLYKHCWEPCESKNSSQFVDRHTGGTAEPQ